MIKKRNMFFSLLLIVWILISLGACVKTEKAKTKRTADLRKKVQLNKQEIKKTDMSKGTCTDCHTTDEKGNLTFETADKKIQLKQNGAGHKTD